MSTSKACHLAQFSCTPVYRKSRAKDQSVLRLCIREIADAQRRFGYQRIHVMLRREGWPVNKERFRRLYRLEGLQLRMRVRRRKPMCLYGGLVRQPKAPGDRWSMAYLYDQLLDGRLFRMLTVVDQRDLESPLVKADFSMPGQKVAAAPDRRLADGKPVHNGHIELFKARLHMNV